MFAGHLPNSIGVIDGETWISTPEGNRPATEADVAAYEQSQQQARDVQAQRFNADPAMTQFTPDQVQAYLADPGVFTANNAALVGGKGIYNDNLDGAGALNLWAGPEGTRTNGANWSLQPFNDPFGGGAPHDMSPFSGAGTEDRNNMLYGASIAALPFAVAGSAAAIGAGAGAAEGGTAGAGALGAESGGVGSGALIGEAGSDTLGSTSMMPAAQAEDVFGGYNIDPNSGDVFHGTGDNPFGSNFSGGDTNAFFNGTESGVDPNLLQRAQDLAKQLGITPASALQSLLKAGGGSLGGLLAKAAPAAIGVIGANQQANSLSALADKYMAFGAPSRARYEASYAPGFTMANEPGYKDALDQTTKATLHGLSVNGNPAGSPNAWDRTLSDVNSKFAFPALQRFREQNANTGGIGTLTAAAPGAATGAIGAQGNVFNAVGAGINDIFNPQPSLADIIKMLRSPTGAVA